MSEILSQFRDEELPPSTVDIRGAIRDARRRRRVQVLAAAAAVVALTAAVTALTANPGTNGLPPATTDPVTASPSPSVTLPPAPAAPLSCTGERLPLPSGGTSATALAADPSGRFVAGSSHDDRALLVWDNGSVRAVTAPNEFSYVTDVNSSGVVVGEAYIDGGTRGFVIHGAEATFLPGQNGLARSINASGVIVGSVPGGDSFVPVVWRSETAEPERLTVPEGLTQGEQYLIDDDGTVLGQMSGPASPAGTLVLWGTDGTPVDLAGQYPTRGPGGELLIFSQLMLVDYRGGWAHFRQSGSEISTLWNVHTGETRWVTFSPGVVNAQGWTVSGVDGKRVLDTGAVTVPLPRVSGVDYGAAMATIVSGLSDDGRTVVGYLTGENPELVPVRWRCN